MIKLKAGIDATAFKHFAISTLTDFHSRKSNFHRNGSNFHFCWQCTEEVARTLNVEVQDALHQLTEQRRISRQIISGKYLYTAVDRARRQAQLGARRSIEALPTLVDAGRLEIPEAELKAAILLFHSLLDDNSVACMPDSRRSN